MLTQLVKHGDNTLQLPLQTSLEVLFLDILLSIKTILPSSLLKLLMILAQTLSGHT